MSMVKKIASFEICSFFPRPTWHLKSVLDFFPITSGCTLPGAAPRRIRGGSQGPSPPCHEVGGSTFWDMLPMDYFNSPSRFVPDKRLRRIRTFRCGNLEGEKWYA